MARAARTSHVLLGLGLALAACAPPPGPDRVAEVRTGGGTGRPATAATATPGPLPTLTPSVERSPRSPEPRQAEPGRPRPTATPRPTVPPFAGPVVVGHLRGGAGEPAPQVQLRELFDVEVTRDGTYYALDDASLWRFQADGPVALVAGGRRLAGDRLDGTPAAEAGFGAGRLALALDGEERPLLAWAAAADRSRFERLFRVDAAGRLVPLWAAGAGEALTAVAPGAGDRVMLRVSQGDPPVPKAWYASAGGAKATRVRDATAEERAAAADEAAGRLLGATSGGMADGLLTVPMRTGVRRLDPATGAFSAGNPADRPVVRVDGLGVAMIHPVGRLYKNSELEAMPAGGGTWRRVLYPQYALTRMAGATTTPGGGVLIWGGHPGPEPEFRLVRFGWDGDGDSLVGTRSGGLGLPTASTYAPRQIVAPRAGEVAFLEGMGMGLLRVAAGATMEKLTDAYAMTDPSDGAMVDKVGFQAERMRLDGAGRYYVQHGPKMVFRFEPGGRIARVVLAPDAWTVGDMAVGDDGTTFVTPVATDPTGAAPPVRRYPPAGGGYDLPAGTAGAKAIAAEPGGGLALLLADPTGGPDRLMRWTNAAGLVELGRRKVVPGGRRYPTDPTLAVDPAGRWWLVETAPDGVSPALTRWDPATGQAEALVGTGLPHLPGTDLDAALTAVHGLAFDPAGDLYVADDLNVRRVPGVGR